MLWHSVPLVHTLLFLGFTFCAAADLRPEVAAIKDKFQGPTIPVLTNFMDDQVTINTSAIAANVNEVITRGIRTGDGVLLAGASGGDFPRLSVAQRKQVIQTVIGVANFDVPVIVSVQHSDVDDIIELAKFAEDQQADALQLSPPYYYPATMEDFNRTLEAVFAATNKIPLMIYNTPWEYNPPTGAMDLHLAELQQLADTWPRFQLLKWATDAGPFNYQQVVHGMSDRLAIIDNSNLQVMNYLLGGTGFISHFANVWPEWNVKVHRLLKAGQYQEAQEEISSVYWPWSEFRGKIFGRTALESPVVKAALDLLKGRAGGAVAKPNRRLNSEEMDELYAILKKIGVPNLKERTIGTQVNIQV